VTFNISLSIRKIMIVLVLIAFYLAVQSISGKYVEAYFGTEEPHILSELVRLFNINRESSIPTWYASSLLLVCALLLALIAHVRVLHQVGERRYWRGLAVIFLFLSIDEASEIHERLTVPLQTLFDASGPLYFAWMIAYVPLVLLFGVVYFRFWLILPPRTRKLFFLSGILYLGGAIGIEMIGANMWYQDGGTSLYYSTIGTIEEFFEMLGAVTLIYTLLTHMAGDAVELRIGVRPVTQTSIRATTSSNGHDDDVPLTPESWEVLLEIEAAEAQLAPTATSMRVSDN
jgi:hypothetical protein